MGIHSVALSDEEEAVVGGLVASGDFGDAAEALRAGLALLGRDKAEMDAFVERVNAADDEALRGEFAEGTLDEVFERVLRVARGA